MKPFARFLDLLGKIEDPRRAEGKLYRLPHVIFSLCWRRSGDQIGKVEEVGRFPKNFRRSFRQMAAQNRLWGQGRIQAELARLGFRVSTRTVAKWLRYTNLQRHESTIWAFFCTRECLSAEPRSRIPYVLRGFWGDREFRDGPEIRGIREKIAQGVGKMAVTSEFRAQRGLTKGY